MLNIFFTRTFHFELTFMQFLESVHLIYTLSNQQHIIYIEHQLDEQVILKSLQETHES